jgi:carbonic anhydrase
VSKLDPLLERNREFQTTGAYADLPLIPKQPVFVVTCLDPRVDPAAFLGLGLGDAPVVRNAGGRVTGAVIDDIAFISYLIGTMIGEGPLFEVAVIHHTGCGTGFLADAAFRGAFASRTGIDESVVADEAVVDPEHTVAVDVQRLLASPKVSDRITAAGYVYDLGTGLVRMTVPPAKPTAGRTSKTSGLERQMR